MAALHVHRLMASLPVVFCLALFAEIPRHARAGEPTAKQAGNPADAILGDWRPSDSPDIDIRIFVANGKYVGGVVKAANPAMVNTEMLREIEYLPATQTWKGEVFAVKRGSFVPMTIKLTPGGFEMVAGSGILSKTVEWVRIQPE